MRALTLLNRYQVRPNWRVAGVDYCAGYPANTALKDPATISMPGVTVNTASKTISVTGNNVTLDGYDFSDWHITIQAANTRILNSNFALDGDSTIFGTFAASNLYVGYCVIDGKNDADAGALVSTNGTGITVEYCWLKNAGGDAVQVHNGAATEITLRDNFIEQAGQAPGSHSDFLQVLGGPFTASILFNTPLQTSGFTQGFMLEPNGYAQWPGIIAFGEYGYNTMIGPCTRSPARS